MMSHPVQNLKLERNRGILIKICAPIQTEEILSQENRFYTNLAVFVAIFNAFQDTIQQTKISEKLMCEHKAVTQIKIHIETRENAE